MNTKKGMEFSIPFFGLPGMAVKPSLRNAGVTLIRGKTIRIARALLVTVGSEGSDRK